MKLNESQEATEDDDTWHHVSYLGFGATKRVMSKIYGNHSLLPVSIALPAAATQKEST